MKDRDVCDHGGHLLHVLHLRRQRCGLCSRQADRQAGEQDQDEQQQSEVCIHSGPAALRTALSHVSAAPDSEGGRGRRNGLFRERAREKVNLKVVQLDFILLFSVLVYAKISLAKIKNIYAALFIASHIFLVTGYKSYNPPISQYQISPGDLVCFIGMGHFKLGFYSDPQGCCKRAAVRNFADTIFQNGT